MDAPHQVLTLRGLLSRVVPGVFALVVAIWFYDWLAPNPIESLCLLEWGKPVKAKFLDAYEDYQEEEAGPGYMYGIVQYEFIAENGEKVTSSTRQLKGGLPEEWLDEKTRPLTIDIEYFPNYPRWNRIQGTGIDSFFDWLWRQALLGTLLLVLFLSPGVALLKTGIGEIRAALREPIEAKQVKLSLEEAHGNRVWLFGWVLGIVSAFVFMGIGARPLIPLILSLSLVAALTVVYLLVRRGGP
ncbi:MAG: hypothetical protein L6Q31_12175 [Fimbriimonadaceae bacterium]|nr:hypothetical protein [Fimbriimonadaceae bacterium]NUM39275.1 hypothetical protein [Armatimonadota bacterium]